MNRRAIAAFVVAWVLSLVSVALWAQGSQREAPVTVIRPGQPMGDVITGENIGFQRVSASREDPGKVVGRWMVKIDGKWLETQAPVAIVR